MSKKQPQQPLFCPADKEDMYYKAIKTIADLVIFDWEDAVAKSEKSKARILLYNYLQKATLDKPIAIRINAINTKEGLQDILFLSEQTIFPDYIVLPKVESSTHIELVNNLILKYQGKYILMIETAKGINRLRKILIRCKQYIACVMIGSADLSSDLNAENTKQALAYAYGKIITTSAEFNIPVLDSPFFTIDDIKLLEEDTRLGKHIGLMGRASIHPKHLKTIQTVYAPTEKEIETAKKIIQLISQGVAVLDGQMIDEAMAIKAKRILDKL